MDDVTALIASAHAGDTQANAELFSLVYAQLKRMARHQVRRLPDASMQTTTLVHEAYFRLARPESLDLVDRAHFFAVAARAMRQLLIDAARARHAVKRGEQEPLPIQSGAADALAIHSDDDVFALEQAMTHLQELDPGLATLVELRFHAGLDLHQIADLTGRSERSLKRDWRKARAFLHAQLLPVAADP